jgi:hypothetical protein
MYPVVDIQILQKEEYPKQACESCQYIPEFLLQYIIIHMAYKTALGPFGMQLQKHYLDNYPDNEI